MPDAIYRATCRCGEVELEARGPHLIHIACYCDDCQAAAAHFESLPGGWSGREDDGGTPNVLFRKDRVRFVRGESLLEGFRLRPDSATERLVATCCQTAFGQKHHDHKPHHGVQTARITSAAPPMELRCFTRHAPDPVKIQRDAPHARGAGLLLVWRMIVGMIKRWLQRPRTTR